jgi:hypothetical protein
MRVSLLRRIEQGMKSLNAEVQRAQRATEKYKIVFISVSLTCFLCVLCASALKVFGFQPATSFSV